MFSSKTVASFRSVLLHHRSFCARNSPSLLLLRRFRSGSQPNTALRRRVYSPAFITLNRAFLSSKRSRNAGKIEGTGASVSREPAIKNDSWWQRWLAPKEMPERHTFAWYREMLLICTVFAITGSASMVLVRPAVKDVLGIQGSMKEGPWSYRICSLVILSPVYGILLVLVGTIFGRHAYFRYFSVKIFSRFGIPPELLDKNFHQTKKTFKKW